MALVALTESVLGQDSIHWTFYKGSDGLPDSTLTSISFTPLGKVIAASGITGRAAELDGYSVRRFSAPLAFIGPIRESPGGQKWALDSRGLLEFKNGGWVLHRVPEIIAEFHSDTLAAANRIPFLPVRQGCVMFLLPKALMEFSASEPASSLVLHAAVQSGIGPFAGMAVSPDGRLWICGGRGMARADGLLRNITPDTVWRDYLPPGNLEIRNLRQPIPDEDGGITMIANRGSGRRDAIVAFDGRDWIALPDGHEKFLHAWRGPDRRYWGATVESLFQWDQTLTNWAEREDISPGKVFDVDVEPGGAFWLVTSEGLIRGSAALWQQPTAVTALNSPVHGVTADTAGCLYFIADGQLHVLKNDHDRKFPLLPCLMNGSAAGLYPIVDGPLIIEAGNRLFAFRQNGSFESIGPQDGRTVVPLGYLPAGSLCLWLPGTNSAFDEYDGGFAPWKDAPSVKGPGSEFGTLFAARNGDLWLGGKREILWRHNEKWREFDSADHSSPEEAVGFAETPDGKIWCATRDDLWQFDGTGWLLLQVKFNHINSLTQSRDGSIWVAAAGGLFRYYQGAWLDCGGQEGFPDGAVGGACEDARGQIWAATMHGLRVFHPEADPDPPLTTVHELDNDGLTEGGTLNLLLDGQDRWKFVPAWRLLYSYQLDQDGWSPFRDAPTLSFPGLAAGKHYFQVRAIDPAGNLESAPAMLDFTVAVPWFREIRLWAILLPGLGTAICFAALALNRHRQLVLSHAAVERKVAERTRELEMATRELLHSQKMNALGTLAAGIAHDFNNILSIIKGSAQIIEDNPDNSDKVRLRVARIKTVVQQGAEIVDAMLGFSRGSEALPSPCDVNAVVADTIKLLGDRFLREVDVKFSRAEKLPEILAPREFIQQILLNFIFNAAEAMAAKKEITLAITSTTILPPDLFLAPASADLFVLISVKDTGAGILPEIMPRIFEPFFTTKALSSKRGTGLGLSMVYELAKKMSAGLAVQSVVGQGSVFTLVLPFTNHQDDRLPTPKEASYGTRSSLDR